jgi:hypothetical protein
MFSSKSITTTAIILASLVIFSSCKEDKVVSTPVPAQLTIKSFYPVNCSIGDSITILGSNFDMYSDLSVSISKVYTDIPIQIISKKASELVIILPDIADGIYSINLNYDKVYKISADSRLIVDRKLSKFAIYSFSPQNVSTGDTVTVIGKNLNVFDDQKITVILESTIVEATICSKKSSELKFIVPYVKTGLYTIAYSKSDTTILLPSKVKIEKVFDYSRIRNMEFQVWNIPTSYHMSGYSYYQGHPLSNSDTTVVGYLMNKYTKISNIYWDQIRGDTIFNRDIPQRKLKLIRKHGLDKFNIELLYLYFDVITCQDQYVASGFTHGITLQNFNLVQTGDTISFDISGVVLNDIITSYNFTDRYQTLSGHSPTGHGSNVVKLLPMVDSSRVKIIFY